METQIDLSNLIAINPEVRFGKPTLKGTRITVSEVLMMLAGMTREEIADDFPQITDEQIKAALIFAAREADTVVVKVS